MNQNMIQIGHCKGCDKFTRLDGEDIFTEVASKHIFGICQDCLIHPKRGRKWADMSHRIRTDPNFALGVYLQIRTAGGRKIFVGNYGLPVGAERAPWNFPVGVQ